MKHILFGLLVLSLFVACAQEPSRELPIAPEEPLAVPQESESAPPEDVVVDEEEVADWRLGMDSDEVPTQPVPAEVSALIQRAQERTAQGYSFRYHTRIDGLPGQAIYEGARVHVRDDIVLAELTALTRLPETRQHVNRLALTPEEEIAWCTTCNEPAFSSQQGLADMPLPLRWLSSVHDIDVQGEQHINNRNTMHVTGTVDGYAVEMWIDQFSGVPLRVVWQDTEYRYERFTLGIPESAVQLP